MAFWPAVKRLVVESDVILLVVDARNPEQSKNKELEKLVFESAKDTIIVFNKTDLISEEKLKQLRKDHPKAMFTFTPKKVGIDRLRKTVENIADGLGLDTIKVGVVGYPNVGKSALINALAGTKVVEVSPISGTTKRLKFIKSGRLKIIDSPGVVPFDDSEAKLAVIGAKNPERMKNPEKIACEIIKEILGKNKNVLDEYLGFEITTDNEEEVLELIGKKRGYLSKGGIVDLRKTSIQLVRDLQRGKISL